MSIKSISIAIIALVLSTNATAGLITFMNDQTGWETQIGGSGSITGIENFNGYTSDVSAHDTTINLPLFSITASSANPSLNIIDVPTYSNAQANQDGTPSYLGYQNVTIDFIQNLTSLSFGYLDAGATPSQTYGLEVFFTGGGSSTFTLGNPADVVFIGIATDGGMLIDSIAWVLPTSPSPFSVDNFQVVAAVPIPAAVWLFGSGLIGLIGVARSKART